MAEELDDFLETELGKMALKIGGVVVASLTLLLQGSHCGPLLANAPVDKIAKGFGSLSLFCLERALHADGIPLSHEARGKVSMLLGCVCVPLMSRNLIGYEMRDDDRESLVSFAQELQQTWFANVDSELSPHYYVSKEAIEYMGLEHDIFLNTAISIWQSKTTIAMIELLRDTE